MADLHAEAVNDLEGATLKGLWNRSPEKGQIKAAKYGCSTYASADELLSDLEIDAVFILTNMETHAEYTIKAARAGKHILVEKPIARQVSEADAMIAASDTTGHTLGVIFQHRYRPEIQAAKALIEAGTLGIIQHVELTAFWTRSASYYRLGAWRGTWRGEGGGILMNQAPHHLDLLCFLIGQPAEVFATTPTARHAIQTEDTVQGHLIWANGALGALHASTAEAGPSERWQIVGTRGILELTRGTITHWQFPYDIDDHIRTADPYATMPMVEVPVAPGKGTGDHRDVYRQFIQAIVNGGPFVDGRQGRLSLELANALILSSHSHAPVKLPIDRTAYAALLERLAAEN